MSDFEKIESLEDEDTKLEKTSYKMNFPDFDNIEFPSDNVEKVNSREEIVENVVNSSTESVEKDKNDNQINELSTEAVDKNNNSSNNNNFRTITMVLIFVVVLLVVYFLPNISRFFSELTNKEKVSTEKITTGTLKCSLDRDSDEFSYEYNSNFTFSDSKLTNLDYSYTIIGDKSVNEEELNSFNDKCKLLNMMVEDLDGINISCKLKDDKFIQTQVIDYLYIDEAKTTSAYSEAGGIYPNFYKNQNIDEIEKNMKSSGYKCIREK